MKKISSIILIVSVFLSLAYFSFAHQAKAQITTGTGPVCNQSAFVNLLSPAPGMVLMGDRAPLRASATPSAVVAKVEFHIQEHGTIATGSLDFSNPTNWNASWNSKALPNGDYTMFAQAWYLSDSNYITCNSPEIRIKISNETTTVAQTSTEKLVLYMNPFYWDGPINSGSNFKATAMIEDVTGTSRDVTAATAFTWKTSIGSIVPASNQAAFKSGSATGVGTVKVHAVYQDKISDGIINIKVLANTSQTTTAASDYTSTSDTSSPATAVQTASELSKAEPSAEAVSCLQQVLGAEKYAAYLAGKTKPTPEEFEKAWSCLGKTRYIVPSYLAPVTPDEVRKLPRNKDFRFNDIRTSVSKTAEGKNKQVLVLSGNTTPNSSVLIYIFSDPIVLAAKSDSDGNWSYQLEDPMAPGKHEAYVAVSKDGVYSASKPLVFEIAQAESSDSNPQGASLVLANDTPYGSQNYLWYAFGLVLVALGFVFLFVRYKKSLKVGQADAN